MFSSLKNSYHPRTSAFVRYCPLVARVLGSVNAALLFQRIQDLEAMYASRDRAFFRTNADLMADLSLGRYELQSARKVLEERGVYTVFQKPNDQKNWFKVNYDACDAVLRQCNAIAHEEDQKAVGPVIFAPEVADTPLLETRPPLLETSNTPSGNQQQRRKREEREEEISLSGTDAPETAPLRRSWAVVEQELCALMPSHSKALREWCEYKRLRRDKPYLAAYVTTFANKHKSRSTAQFASMVQQSLEQQYQGLFEVKKTQPPSSAPPPSPSKYTKAELDYLTGKTNEVCQ